MKTNISEKQQAPFNQTNVELKFVASCSVMLAAMAFNQTNVELKSSLTHWVGITCDF